VAVEIGAGYGGLARLFKLAAPGVTYCIIDLHECLYFSLFFLKSHFPCASYCLVDGRDRLLEALERPRDFDFIFIPASLIDGFASSREALTANLVINTASFGEMTQSAVDRYVRLIQAELEVDFFYSHNRFGSLDMVPEYTTPLDPYWTTMMWKRRGRDTFTHIEPMTPPSLELIVGRRPRAAVSAAALRIEADRHFDLAMRGAPSANRLDAEYHLWESVRLSPNAANLKAWCDRLRDDCPAELAYFERARLLNR
jgi:hypothetical protein